MRFLEVVVLQVCVFHLVFAMAQMAIGGETFFDRAELGPEAEEAFVEDLTEPEEDEDAKPDEAFLEDVSEPEEKDGKLDEYLKPNENDKRGAFFLTDAPPTHLTSTRPQPPTRRTEVFNLPPYSELILF